MQVTAKIKYVETGEIRATYHDWGSDWGGADVIRFHWSEGNNCCDCNRELFYLRAAGELGENEFTDADCTEDRYLVQVSANGILLLDEFALDD